MNNNIRKSVLVTGGSEGLGFVIAAKYLKEGYDVVFIARNKKNLEKSFKILSKYKMDDQKLIADQCDISKPNDCKKIFSKIKSELKNLDVLINNAGVFGPIGHLTKLSWNKFVNNININLLGTIYMCKLAIPLLSKIQNGNIINISGGGAAKPFPPLVCYATGKAGLARFTEELAEDLKKNHIDVNMIAPGPLNTRFVDVALKYGKENLGDELYETILKIKETGGSLERVAELCFYISSKKCQGITGKFISARYDDWQNLHQRKKEIMKSEVYTMRRIDSFNVKKFSKLKL